MRFRTTTTAAFLFSSAAYSSTPPPACFTAISSPSSSLGGRASSSSPGSRAAKSSCLVGPLGAAPPTTPSSSTADRSEFAPPPRRVLPLPPPASSSASSSSPRAVTPANNGSPLSAVVDSQREFETNLGRAVDSLRHDYPELLTRDPNWDVYHPRIEAIDPTGVRMTGLENYKMAFGFVHGVVKWFYCEDRSGMTSVRVGYDWARKCIRVSWNVELVPKMIYGGTRNTLHVDGISEYHLDRESGLITDHRITHLLINDQAVRPANGIFRALADVAGGAGQQHLDQPEGVPVFFRPTAAAATATTATLVEFRTRPPPPIGNLAAGPSSPSSLFSSNPNEHAADMSEMGFNHAPYDRDALQRKNASRKKFGMRPLTPEEFVAVEEEVRSMDAINKKKASYLAEKLAQQSSNRKKKKEDSFLSNIFGGVFKNGCESNFDCERPQVCCDVGFKRICCSNGLGIVDGIPVERYERGLLRVPLPNDNYDY